MKGLFTASLAAAFAFTLSTTDASAQWAFLGVAGTVPVSDYADFGDGDGAKLGYMLNGGVMVPVGEGRVSIGGGGYFGSNSHDTEGDKTNLYGVNALAGVSLSEPYASARPFLFGGGGYMAHSYKSVDFPSLEGTEGSFAATGGAGVALTAGESLGIMVSGSYTMGFGNNDGTTFVSFGAAAQIPFGN